MFGHLVSAEEGRKFLRPESVCHPVYSAVVRPDVVVQVLDLSNGSQPHRDVQLQQDLLGLIHHLIDPLLGLPDVPIKDPLDNIWTKHKFCNKSTLNNPYDPMPFEHIINYIHYSVSPKLCCY